MENVESYAQKIWDYMKMNQALEKADVIVMFGSYDSSVADCTIELYKNGWAPLVVFSGNRGEYTKEWTISEADKFGEMALKLGVPKDRIFIENKSNNTKENVLFTKQLLEKENIFPKKIILVQKPFMERRAWATFKKQWPEVGVIVVSPEVEFKNYLIPDFSREKLIGAITGDLERLKLYAKQGYLVEQDIPDDVWQARNKIREAGYMVRFIEV